MKWEGRVIEGSRRWWTEYRRVDRWFYRLRGWSSPYSYHDSRDDAVAFCDLTVKQLAHEPSIVHFARSPQ